MAEISIDNIFCKGCSLCVDICRKRVLSISDKPDESGYKKAVVIDSKSCNGCLFCYIICPDVAITVKRYASDG